MTIISLLIAAISLAIAVLSIRRARQAKRIVQRCECGHFRGNHFDNASACEHFECQCCQFEKLKPPMIYYSMRIPPP